MSNLLVGQSVDVASLSALGEASNFGFRRPNALGETMNRRFASTALQPITAQPVHTAIFLTAGTVVTSLTFCSNTTAGATLTHQIAGLSSSAFVPLVQSADATSAAWAASSEKTFTMSAPYTVLTDGLYYASLCVAASTVPTICGVAANAVLVNQAPALSFTDTSSTVTGTFPNPAIQSAGFGSLYAYVK